MFHYINFSILFLKYYEMHYKRKSFICHDNLNELCNLSSFFILIGFLFSITFI